ncbi:type IV pilus assembly protein PilM [Gloeocapsa sp. PCC 73106]|uniref:type IV pilus assembly protein PilM n=1 Tax=Gloeocapsa sp. PCC 73106 TaxID=102232 RepID=UPI0002ABC775|nr:type IV pilus assembly protein PilM [Gloeocapsa sp. PCC 73106]ELR98707.1 type IV pilus assembly protein PilM [Gloeocapsa sp. PCC 73106]
MFSSLTNLLGKKNLGIGVEIATDKVNIAQLVKQGSQYKLSKYSSKEIPEGIFQEGKITDAPSLAELIEDMFKEAKINVKKVATAVPMREAIIRIIPIPAELSAEESNDLILNHEAALYLPYPRDEVDLDFIPLGNFLDDDGIEKVRVLLVATRREITDIYRETFKQAGLQLEILEINSFSLIRTIREQLRQFVAQEAAVLVDIEFDNTEIAIIVQGVPQFSRTVPIGIYQLHTALAQAMNLPVTRNIELLQDITIPNTPIDTQGTGATHINPGMASLLRVLGELTEELRRSISFYTNQANEVEIAQILLAGPGSAIGQIDEFFTQKLNLPTVAIDPIAALPVQMEQEVNSIERAGLGTVLGLGLRMSEKYV